MKVSLIIRLTALPVLVAGLAAGSLRHRVRVMQTNSTDTILQLIDPETNRIVTEIDGIR